MKKLLFMCVLGAMSLASQAQDLVIETIHANSENVKILQDARFTPDNNCIGFTSENTRVDLGEVDFGDGSVYNAVGINFANGYDGDNSYAILSFGTTFQNAKPFAQIGLARTSKYYDFKVFAFNMGYKYNGTVIGNWNINNKYTQLPGGKNMSGAISFTKPTGKQRVFLWFVNGAGNIRDVIFYKNELTANSDLDNNRRLLDPNERTSYPHTVLPVSNSNLVSSPSPETRIDGDSWGWTQSDVIVDYGEVDFENGKYGQILAYYRHWSFNENDNIEFYIDDANNPANYLGSLFTGFEIRNEEDRNILWPGATNIPTVTGVHHLLVKWVGGSSNIGDIHLVEGRQWVPAKPCDLVIENEQPTQDAMHYTFLNDVPSGATKVQYEIINRGDVDGPGNVGWTGDGTIVKLKNIDFDHGQYNRLIVNHSSDKQWIDYIEHSSFAFFIDNFDPANYDQYLDNLVSVVRIQGTNDWNVRKATAGELKSVTGVHDVYVYYNLSALGLDAGSNVYDIYLDAVAKGDDFTWNSVTGHSRFEENELTNSYKNTVNVSLNKFVKIANQQRTLYRTNQATGAKTPICTLSFNNTGKEFTVSYASPMAVNNPMRYDTDFLVEAGATRNPIVINDYLTASTAQGGDKAGAYVYSIDGDDETVSVPVYAATVAAKPAMADGSTGYTAEQILADTDHALKAQAGYAVTLENVTEGASSVELYLDKEKLAGTYSTSAQNFISMEEMPLTATVGAALKVGDNTYGTNLVAVHAAVLKTMVYGKIKTEFEFNNGSRYFAFQIKTDLEAIDGEEFETTGGGYRVWRTCETSDEVYQEMAQRATDYLFYNNMGMTESVMSLEGIGGENLTFVGAVNNTINYTSGTFGSSSSNPVVVLRVRAYYKAADGARKVKANAATDGAYLVAESLVQFDFSQNVITGLYDVTGVRPVQDINYYNVAGQVSKTPHKGVNIIVTTYEDGTTSTRKQIIR